MLTARLPYPSIGGDRLRIYELSRALSRTHRLTLLCLCETKEELHRLLPDDGIFTKVERVLLPRWRSLLNTIAAVPTSTPLQIAYYRSAEFARRLTSLLSQHDCCLAHLIRTGAYLRNLHIPKVLEMTDAMSLTYSRARQLRKTNPLMALVYGLEAPRLLRYERSIIRDFSATILVSDVDKDFLLDGMSNENVIVAPNGVDTSLLPYADRTTSDPVIIYIGTMTSAYNLDACLFFATEVLPRARRVIDCRLRVIGRIRPSERRRLMALDGVEVLGNVPNIAGAVGNARVGVAPIRVGAGIKNKILEYMALGLPVISSPIGLEGISARPGIDLLLAERPEEYVEQLARIWHDRELASSLSRHGLNYVKTHHSWALTTRPLIGAIERSISSS